MRERTLSTESLLRGAVGLQAWLNAEESAIAAHGTVQEQEAALIRLNELREVLNSVYEPVATDLFPKTELDRSRNAVRLLESSDSVDSVESEAVYSDEYLENVISESDIHDQGDPRTDEEVSAMYADAEDTPVETLDLEETEETETDIVFSEGDAGFISHAEREGETIDDLARDVTKYEGAAVESQDVLEGQFSEVGTASTVLDELTGESEDFTESSIDDLLGDVADEYAAKHAASEEVGDRVVEDDDSSDYDDDVFGVDSGELSDGDEPWGTDEGSEYDDDDENEPPAPAAVYI